VLVNRCPHAAAAALGYMKKFFVVPTCPSYSPPSKLEPVINLKAAKALGLTLPLSLYACRRNGRVVKITTRIHGRKTSVSLSGTRSMKLLQLKRFVSPNSFIEING
jgi:hypothetical protein